MTHMTAAERRIPAPFDRVVPAVTDLAAYPTWAHEVSEVEILDTDAAGMPRRARLHFAAGALRDQVVLDYVVVAGQGRATMTWSLVSAERLAALDGRYDLTALDATSTLVRYAVQVDPGLPLHTALREKMQARITEAALDALERHVVSAI